MDIKHIVSLAILFVSLGMGINFIAYCFTGTKTDRQSR